MEIVFKLSLKWEFINENTEFQNVDNLYCMKNKMHIATQTYYKTPYALYESQFLQFV